MSWLPQDRAESVQTSSEYAGSVVDNVSVEPTPKKKRGPNKKKTPKTPEYLDIPQDILTAPFPIRRKVPKQQKQEQKKARKKGGSTGGDRPGDSGDHHKTPVATVAVPGDSLPKLKSVSSGGIEKKKRKKLALPEKWKGSGLKIIRSLLACVSQVAEAAYQKKVQLQE